MTHERDVQNSHIKITANWSLQCHAMQMVSKRWQNMTVQDAGTQAAVCSAVGYRWNYRFCKWNKPLLRRYAKRATALVPCTFLRLNCGVRPGSPQFSRILDLPTSPAPAARILHVPGIFPSDAAVVVRLRAGSRRLLIGPTSRSSSSYHQGDF